MITSALGNIQHFFRRMTPAEAAINGFAEMLAASVAKIVPAVQVVAVGGAACEIRRQVAGNSICLAVVLPTVCE